MQRRTDHRQTIFFRADRFHRINGWWYFLTREGANVGPFENKQRAQFELELMLGMSSASVMKN